VTVSHSPICYCRRCRVIFTVGPDQPELDAVDAPFYVIYVFEQLHETGEGWTHTWGGSASQRERPPMVISFSSAAGVLSSSSPEATDSKCRATSSRASRQSISTRVLPLSMLVPHPLHLARYPTGSIYAPEIPTSRLPNEVEGKSQASHTPGALLTFLYPVSSTPTRRPGSRRDFFAGPASGAGTSSWDCAPERYW